MNHQHTRRQSVDSGYGDSKGGCHESERGASNRVIGLGGETTYPCLQVLGGQALHVRVDDLTEARGAAVEVCDDARALLGRREERLLVGELRVPA
jgi:hypothetical protein